MAVRDVFNLPLWHRYVYAMVKTWVQDYLPKPNFADYYGMSPSNAWIADHR